MVNHGIPLRTSGRAVAVLLGVTVVFTGAAEVPAGTRDISSPPPSSPALSSILQGGVPRDRAELKAMEEHVRRLLEKVRRATVTLSGGSGVVVTEDGYVLTVAHVNQRAGRTVTMTFPDGRRVRGKTLGNDRGLDAGLVKITDKGTWPYTPMGKSGDVRPGEWCLALGYPAPFRRSGTPVVRLGRVIRTDGQAVVTDCTIMGGDSGGPLFDLDGKVIGISSRCDPSVTRNYHVPVDVYHSSWERFVKGEDFNSRGTDRTRDGGSNVFLGVAPASDGKKPEIGQVTADSAAEKAGIKAGDIVVSFDGKKISAYRDLPPLIRAKKPGDKVSIVVRRGKDLITLQATLGER